MTRSTAREIAVHLIFSLGFGTQSAEEVLDSELTRERFEELGGESQLYAQFPNEKQERYIRDLVRGVFAHGPELDDYIARYAVGWSFARIPRMAAAILRTAMYEVLYMPDIPNAAAIDAAVEMTKKYEPQEVVSMSVLALDTSNYTTSAAAFDGREGENVGRLLQVRPGELGLRQSDALFQHVKQLPQLMEQLASQGQLENIQAVGASTRPRAVEGSYMPCFLAGTSQAQCLARTLGVPFFAFSHQQGHLAAAAWSAGRLDLLEGPFLAWHLSGGTTELLRAEPEQDGVAMTAEILGGTSDISAGQLIDRTGVLLGLQFPAGKALDGLSAQAEKVKPFPVKVENCTFSLSGIENKVKQMSEKGEAPETVARFALETVARAVVKATRQALERFPGLPVLCSGGVASNSLLRQVMERECGAIFAQPRFSTDNAMGTAILTWRALEPERAQ